MVNGNRADVISGLQELVEKRLIWFSHHQMKLNIDKFDHLLNTQKQNIAKIEKYGGEWKNNGNYDPFIHNVSN